MPGSQLAARIYTTNGAPTASPALTHAHTDRHTHITHKCIHSALISTRRRKVSSTGREGEKDRVREREQEGSYLLEWCSTIQTHWLDQTHWKSNSEHKVTEPLQSNTPLVTDKDTD